ncbi:hypothetical protein B0J14DRAFT_557509 [Halenospora varia]|nr:hypothetical protein B0J14DRAFT_557509 [Halenospora varia]
MNSVILDPQETSRQRREDEKFFFELPLLLEGKPIPKAIPTPVQNDWSIGTRYMIVMSGEQCLFILILLTPQIHWRVLFWWQYLYLFLVHVPAETLDRYYQREEAVERDVEGRIEVALQARDLEAGVRLEVENGKLSTITNLIAKLNSSSERDTPQKVSCCASYREHSILFTHYEGFGIVAELMKRETRTPLTVEQIENLMLILERNIIIVYSPRSKDNIRVLDPLETNLYEIGSCLGPFISNIPDVCDINIQVFFEGNELHARAHRGSLIPNGELKELVETCLDPRTLEMPLGYQIIGYKTAINNILKVGLGHESFGRRDLHLPLFGIYCMVRNAESTFKVALIVYLHMEPQIEPPISPYLRLDTLFLLVDFGLPRVGDVNFPVLGEEILGMTEDIWCPLRMRLAKGTVRYFGAKSAIPVYELDAAADAVMLKCGLDHERGVKGPLYSYGDLLTPKSELEFEEKLRTLLEWTIGE